NLDFASVDGLIAALQSPNIAAADAARRSLIDLVRPDPVVGRTQPWMMQVQKVVGALGKLGAPGQRDVARARALWTTYAMVDVISRVDLMARPILEDPDPRFRELAVRMLARDCADNGNVAYPHPEAKRPPSAMKNLELLTKRAEDPDA